MIKSETKREHNIISRVISSHMGPMYTETPCISTPQIKKLRINIVWLYTNGKCLVPQVRRLKYLLFLKISMIYKLY